MLKYTLDTIMTTDADGNIYLAIRKADHGVIY